MTVAAHSVEDTLAAIIRGDRAALTFDARALSTFLDAAARHGVRTIVADRLRQTQGSGWSPEVQEALDRECSIAAAGEALRQRELKQVLHQLTERGLQPVLLKGTALAYTLYSDPSHRGRFDTDLLVRREDLPTVDYAMAARGYVRANQVTGELVMHQVDYIRKDEQGIRHVYDFHWKLANRQAVAGILTYDEVVTEAALGPSGRAIGRIHALLHACVHRVAHHPGDERLIWVYDIHLLVSSLSPAEMRTFEVLATARSVGAICAAGLSAAQQWFYTSLPDGLLDRLDAARANGREPSATLLQTESGSFKEFMSDFRALPGWAGRARLMYEHAFPPSSYMAGTYMVSNRIWLPALYTHRIFRGAWRWVRGGSR